MAGGACLSTQPVGAHIPPPLLPARARQEQPNVTAVPVHVAIYCIADTATLLACTRMRPCNRTTTTLSIITAPNLPWGDAARTSWIWVTNRIGSFANEGARHEGARHLPDRSRPPSMRLNPPFSHTPFPARAPRALGTTQGNT